MSIESQLATLAANKAAIKAAIEAKSPNTMPTDQLSQWPTSIVSIPSGGGALNVDISEGATFFDYNGTILYHWTAAETASKIALPPLPSHAGLTCQEWNWDLTDIKTDVAAGAFVHVGATYTTDDGKTRIHVTVPEMSRTVTMSFSQTVANSVTINWGDGSEEETLDGTGSKTPSHTYESESYPASFVITLEVTDGTVNFGAGGSGNFLNAGTTEPGVNNFNTRWKSDVVRSIEIGDRITMLNQSAFMYLGALRTITIPNTVTTSWGEGRLFMQSVSPAAVIFPKGMNVYKQCFSYSQAPRIVSWPKDVDLGTAGGSLDSASCPNVISVPGVDMLPPSMFSGSTGLKVVSLGEGMTQIGSNAFKNCSSLVSVRMPSTLTSIGGSAFYGCSSLRSVEIPSGVTSLGSSLFYNCAMLESVTIPEAATVSLNSMFYQCYSLVEVNIPEGTTSIGSYAFYNCRALKSVAIPSTVTSIGSNAFEGCTRIASLEFPAGITSIAGYAFASTYQSWISGSGITVFDFRRASAVPTLSNTSAFYSTHANKEIIVPDELYEDWIAANNWNSSTNGIVDSIVKASESSLGPLPAA